MAETSSSVQDVPAPITIHALTETSNRSPRAKCTFTVRNTSVRTANKTLLMLAACSIDGKVPYYSGPLNEIGTNLGLQPLV